MKLPANRFGRVTDDYARVGDETADLLNDGFTFVACGTDTGLLAKGADNLLAQMRETTKER